jgi:hypothetical protein
MSAKRAVIVDRSVLDGECITIFGAAIGSRYTLDPYERRLVDFLNYIGKTCNEFVSIAKTNPDEAERLSISS